MLIDIYRQAYFNRQFELKVVEAHKRGLIKAPIYLSIGTESIPAAIADVSKDWLVFPQHRCHSWLLSFGADPTAVAREILGLPDGLNKGMGGSASLAAPELGVYGHDGHLGSNAPIAVGMCHASGKQTIAHLGDASVEEDYVLACLGYAATYKLPILFIVEDNDLSILTPIKKRRSWNIVDVAKGFGIVSDNIVDYPMGIRERARIHLEKHKKGESFPCLINIRCQRHLWHCGSESDAPPKYDILTWIKSHLTSDWDNWEKEEEIVEQEQEVIKNKVNAIWEPLLC